MRFAFKRHGAKDILQKHVLKYVLGIRRILQMQHTEPANHIRILLDRSVHLLFAPHGPVSCSLPCYQRQPFPRPARHPLCAGRSSHRRLRPHSGNTVRHCHRCLAVCVNVAAILSALSQMRHRLRPHTAARAPGPRQTRLSFHSQHHCCCQNTNPHLFHRDHSSSSDSRFRLHFSYDPAAAIHSFFKIFSVFIVAPTTRPGNRSSYLQNKSAAAGFSAAACCAHFVSVSDDFIMTVMTVPAPSVTVRQISASPIVRARSESSESLVNTPSSACV